MVVGVVEVTTTTTTMVITTLMFGGERHTDHVTVLVVATVLGGHYVLLATAIVLVEEVAVRDYAHRQLIVEGVHHYDCRVLVVVMTMIMFFIKRIMTSRMVLANISLDSHW